MPAAHRLVVVDDEDNLRTMLCAALRHLGFEVTETNNGRSALELVATERPDLIVLDVMMPDLDGFEVCRRLRQDNDHTPVLFLTAAGEAEARVRGLTLGGDDYLAKPFNIDELVARIEAILRRTRQHAAHSDVYEAADLVLDDGAHRVTRGGHEIDLSPTEYNLLRYLLINQGQACSKHQILDHVWNYDFDGDTGIVEKYIGYVRRKVDTTEPKLIHTIRGIGYTLRAR